MLGWRSSQSHLAVDEAAVRPTGVQISHPAHRRDRLDGSVAERFLGKKEVSGPIPDLGSALSISFLPQIVYN
jgi:hypothetical protein